MTTTDTRVGILGGTFDPIHNGHIAVADAACAALALHRVLVIPSHHPPHRRVQPQASSYHRFAMVAMATVPRAQPVEYMASDMELLAARDRSYTALTLRQLQAGGLRARQMFFITGADAFAEIASWNDYPAILELTHFVVVSRPRHPARRMPELLPALRDRMMLTHLEGPQRDLIMRSVATDAPVAVEAADRLGIWLVDVPHLSTPDVSSTEIKRRLRDGESIAGLVSPMVEEYIRRHGLYGAETA